MLYFVRTTDFLLILCYQDVSPRFDDGIRDVGHKQSTSSDPNVEYGHGSPIGNKEVTVQLFNYLTINIRVII